MGKPKLSKGAGKRARSSSEEEERGPAQQTIKSYFSKDTCQLWTTVGQESKVNGTRKSLKLSTKKNAVKCNLWGRMDESAGMQSSNSVEHLSQQALDSKQHLLKDNRVEDKSIIEEYMLDTSLENCLLNEESMECLESSVKGNLVPNRQEMSIDHISTDIETAAIEVAQDITEQFKSPIKSNIHKSLLQSSSPGISNLPVQTKTPSKALANTSMDSLADAAELDNLLDGVEWSPMISCPENLHSASNSSSCKALFSPVKGSQNANQISKDLQNKCTLTNNTCLSPSGAAGYSRFLVLEVSRRELLGDEVVAKYGRHLSEKVLRLFEETLSQEKFCSLREEWEMSEVEPGDIVHITGTFDSKTGMCVLDNSTDHYLVVHPDTLVSGTTVSMATKCLRQSILNERFRTEGQNEAMLIGTLLHDLFDLAMEFNEFSTDALLKRASGLLQKLSYLDDLYSLGQTENWAMEKLKENIPLLCDWAKKFVAPFPHPDFGAMDFKTPEYPQHAEQPSVCVSALKDIEENIWSPRFGLKGKVDATVEVKIDRRLKIRRHRPDTGNQVQSKVLPLELKTGKMFTKLGSIEHRAQVILYTLLMSDRYSQAVDAGLLFYMKSAHMLSVPGFLHEKRALVMKRNEVARYLTLNRAGATGTMPAMLKDLNTCKRCSQAQNCTTFHKATEQGDGKTSGLGSFFDEKTDHMSKTYVNYFTDWYKLVCLEGKEMEQKRNQREIWCLEGWEREKLGRCFSSMVLKPHDRDSVIANTRYFRHKFERSVDHPSVTPLQDVPITVGERVILSEENSGATAIAAGYIHEVKKTEVVVLLDRDLTKRYNAQTEETSSKLYRLDKDEEYSTLTTLWSNMAKLFKGDSDRDAQLRRQVVDLEPPVFSRKRRNDTVSMSSQTSDITEFFTQQTPSQSSKSQKSLSDPAVESILQELNSGQRKAVSKALGAHHYALILGMPGTGKTTTISCLVRVLVASGKSVLLTSYTHTAVDNILLKLKEANLDFIRLGQVHKILPELQSYSAQRAAEGIKTVDELRQLYESKSVVATTCLGVNHALFSQRSFDYCIVDEASQITQPVCIGPLRHARVFILVGDHYQLPPLVQSVEAREGGMDISLFKRLSERHPHAVISLEHQYRMNQDIMELSNTLIYEHRLKCGTQCVASAVLELPDWDELVAYVKDSTSGVTDNWLLDALVPSRPVVFLDTDGVPAPENRAEHLVSNETEALLVHQLACALLKAGLKPSSLGIISPYRHQLKLITQVFHSSKQNEIEINTVDKYQGRDKACIIVSLVRSNEHSNVGDLLRDWRRVNVAVTRAKRKLILIGSLVTLKGSLLLQELFDLLERKDWVQVLPYDAHKLFEFLAKSSQTSPVKSLEAQRNRYKH
ncbi:DNA replication ATP-dependent helicase/nuclease DNA2-like isoform X2 [Oculina patagonica]